MCKGQGAVDGHDVRQDAELLPGERVSWPASPPESAPITMLSRGILGGDGDRPELAAAYGVQLLQPSLAFLFSGAGTTFHWVGKNRGIEGNTTMRPPGGGLGCSLGASLESGDLGEGPL